MTTGYDSFSGAEFGGAADGRAPIYRYRLWRMFAAGDPTLLFVALNPSTAAERTDDPTIRRCRSFAIREGFGRFVVVNLFAFRATHPRDLRFAADPIGPQNDAHIHDEAMRAAKVVCAWGAIPKRHHARRDAVLAILGPLHPTLYCLGTTKAGEPRHPLMLRGDEPMVEYRP